MLLPLLLSFLCTPQSISAELTEPACFPIHEPVVVDGLLDEWDRRGPLRIDRSEQRNLFESNQISRHWEGPGDSSATIYLAYDQNDLYLGGEVKDDFRLGDNQIWWTGDCLELFLDMDREGDRANWRWNSDDYQICLMPYNPGRSWGVSLRGSSPLMSDGGLQGVEVASVDTEGAGYSFEVRIPFANFKELDLGKGKIGLNVALNDHDRMPNGERKQNYLTLNGKTNAFADTRNLLDVLFVGNPPRATEDEAGLWVSVKPWVFRGLIGILIIVLLAAILRYVFEWVDTRFSSWRRHGLVFMAAILFVAFVVPILMERFLEWKVRGEFEARSQALMRVVADLGDEMRLHPGRGLDDPERVLRLLGGRSVSTRPHYDFTCFELRSPEDDPNWVTSREGVPVRRYGFELSPLKQYFFPLSEPTFVRSLFLFAEARFEDHARRPGTSAVIEQALEIGVRLADGTEHMASFPLIDRDREKGGETVTDRVGVAWKDDERTVDQFFVGKNAIGDMLVEAVVVRLRDPRVRVFLQGITFAGTEAPDSYVPLSLGRSSLAGPPASIWDGISRGVALTVHSGEDVTVPLNQEVDTLWFFYTTHDARVLESELAGSEVGTIAIHDGDGNVVEVPLRAGVNVWYGGYDPAQRPEEMVSELAFHWKATEKTAQQIELLEQDLSAEEGPLLVEKVVLKNQGVLSSLTLHAVTGGVRRHPVAPPDATVFLDSGRSLRLRPEVAEALSDFGFAVFVDETVLAVDLPDTVVGERLKGVKFPLGEMPPEADESDEIYQTVLFGGPYLVRNIPVGVEGGPSLSVAMTMKVPGLAAVEGTRRRVALIALLLLIPLVLFYVIDVSTRIARLRLRLTTLLVATSLVPIVLLFSALYNVVERDRSRLRESRATAALREVDDRLAETFRQVQRTAGEVMDSEAVRSVRLGSGFDRERIESHLSEVVALNPAPDLDLAVRVELEMRDGRRLRFHDRVEMESSSRFDLADGGIREHWSQLVFLWAEERSGRGSNVRVVVSGELTAKAIHDLGRASSASISLLSLDGYPLAGSSSGDPNLRARDLEDVREQNRPAFREDSGGRLFAVDLVRSPGGAPVALAEVVLPRDSFSLDVLFTNMPLDQFFFWFCVASLVAALFVAAVATRRITRPVEALEGAARKIASGDLDVTVEASAQGEVGRLARSFNLMTAQLKRRDSEQRRLERAMARLGGSMDPDSTANAALEVLSEEPASEACSLYRRDPDRDTLLRVGLPRGKKGLFPLVIPHDQEVSQAMEERRPRILRGDETSLLRDSASEGGGQSRHVLLLPLPLQDHSLGVAILSYPPQVQREQIEQALPILQHLAGQIAVALENSRLYGLAILDPDTGVYIESYFRSRLAEELDRAQHTDMKLSILRFELPDRDATARGMGGKEAMARLARRIRTEAREMYLVGRSKNALFALLPATDRNTAVEFRDLVLRRIELASRGSDEGPRLQVYVGVATFPQDGRSSTYLFDAAARDLAGSRRRTVREVLSKSEDGRETGPKPADLDPYVFQSPRMKELLSQVARVANSTASVLLLGETGVGKEVVADLLHRWSDRAHRPFVAINCSAVPENLLESELFGYEKGAFTGAGKPRVGQLEQADGGTIFLDEVGDMPPQIQAKLLRVLQDRRIVRLGSNRSMEVDVRIIAATNRDLKEMMDQGLFRKDLYFRLKVVSITVPPLRERREDIPALADLCVRRYNRDSSRRVLGLAPSTLDRLYRYSWPGNVRELMNVMRRSILMANGEFIRPSDLQFEVPSKAPSVGISLPSDPMMAGTPGSPASPHHLNERQAKVLAYLATGRSIRSREYFEMVGVSARTGLRDLNGLLERGLIRRVGRRRAATYLIAEQAPNKDLTFPA